MRGDHKRIGCGARARLTRTRVDDHNRRMTISRRRGRVGPAGAFVAVAVFGAATFSAGVGSRAVRADEGMWTYDRFPKAEVRKRYGVEISDAFLTHLQRSSVRIAGGCSASFVSPQGLVITNHHCVHACVQQISTPTQDRVATGFWAATQPEEVKCPEIELNQLLTITDVTARVQTATKGQTGAAYQQARKAVFAQIEKECQTEDTLRCEVVTLYQGGVYDLYKYRRYQDARLVFAPEMAAAFFGGDPDNFNFPRFDLDVAFLRAYENGKPAATPDFFKVAATGAKDGDLTFVSGHPGGTHRQLTVAELTTQRDLTLPDSLLSLAELRGVLTQFGRAGGEARRISEADLFSVENSFKALRGRWQALRDPRLFDAKVAAEQTLRAQVAKSPVRKRAYGQVWDEIARAQARFAQIRKPYAYEEQGAAFAGRLFRIARTLLRAGAELPLPNDKRLEEFQDAGLPALKQRLFSAAPIYPQLEQLRLTQSLSKLREELGTDHPFVRKVLGAESPAELAARLVTGTKLADVGVRRRLFDGGASAVEAAAATDPMLALARLIDGEARAIRKTWETEVDAVLRRNTELLAKARFEIEGTSRYPDATFTLRLSYGAVAGFAEGDRTVAPITTLGGAFERATGREPFALPSSWIANRAKLDPNVPLNLCTTNDIIGGNSGSPVLNRSGELIGVIFDGNIHSLGGDFAFDPALNRAVAVAAPAVVETLRKIYGAQRLLTELGL